MEIFNSISKGTNANMVPGTVDDEDDEWNLMEIRTHRA
jgi:hypothetical protein